MAFSVFSIHRVLEEEVWFTAVLLFTLLQFVSTSTPGQRPRSTAKPLLVAHRGASAYAPEHTLAAYSLAIQQGADFVEQDLQVTKDSVLICAHDAGLARTTDIAQVFPDRATARDPEGQGVPERGWYTIDFTLAEIRRLDAGTWFNRANPFAARASYIKQRVPTLEEAIKAVGGRAGLYIEMKHFEFYKSLGHDMAVKLAAVLDANGFNKPRWSERVLIQSFSKASLLRMREVAPNYPRIQLLPMEDSGRKEDSGRVTVALAKEIADYARGVGPNKSMITSANEVEIFHAAGLIVHPYTFRGSTTAVARRPLDTPQSNGSTLRQEIIAEIERFIGFGIDGGFTDYPDLWRKAVGADRSQKN